VLYVHVVCSMSRSLSGRDPSASGVSTLGFESFKPETGDVVRVPAHSTSPTPVASGLSFPAGFAAGPNGAIYVSNWSIAPADSGGGPTGQVIRIAP
jgi:hypothetical protein